MAEAIFAYLVILLCYILIGVICYMINSAYISRIIEMEPQILNRNIANKIKHLMHIGGGLANLALWPIVLLLNGSFYVGLAYYYKYIAKGKDEYYIYNRLVQIEKNGWKLD